MGQNFKTLVDLWERTTKKYAEREVFGTKSNGSWHYITFASPPRALSVRSRNSANVM